MKIGTAQIEGAAFALAAVLRRPVLRMQRAQAGGSIRAQNADLDTPEED